MILAGDVGGTKVHLALYDFTYGKLEYKREERYAAKDYNGLEEIVKEFIGSDQATAACFGVPGPVRHGRLRLTNLPWTLDSRELSLALGIQHVFLINDLEANGYGIAELTHDQVYTLAEGDPGQIGSRALIAAGTGLGEGMLIWNGHMHIPYPSEGGHCDFAPIGAEQVALLQFLEREFGHASYERTVSGPGVHNIYRFLLEHLPDPEPQWLTELMATGDPSAAIGDAALTARDARCIHTIELFLDIYGAEAANLALKFLAFGGLYIGGGIAPRILPLLQRGGFMRSFLNKGRLNAVLERIAVRISLNQNAALLGAAHLAASIVPRN